MNAGLPVSEPATVSSPFVLTAHQPVYLPWLGLFHKIALADLFISFDQVQYVRKDWMNRNKVKTNTGPVWLSVPVIATNRFEQRIFDLEIDNRQPWARKHWKTLEMAYQKAPFFKLLAPFFEDCYSRRWERLEQLNTYMLRWFLDTLGIPVPVRSAGEYSFQGQKSDLVLDMCRQTNADIYIFGALGKDYADVDSFRRAGIEPVFQEYHHPNYRQLHGPFEPFLSVVDLLFNHGPDSREILLARNLDRDTLRALPPSSRS